MIHDASPETVSLQTAVLCIDCELVTDSRCDACPVCGGHSLLSLAGIVGGALVDYKGANRRGQELRLFNLHISIAVTQLEGGELTAMIERLSKIAASKLATNRATLHISVEPVVSESGVKPKAA